MKKKKKKKENNRFRVKGVEINRNVKFQVPASMNYYYYGMKGSGTEEDV